MIQAYLHSEYKLSLTAPEMVNLYEAINLTTQLFTKKPNVKFEELQNFFTLSSISKKLQTRYRNLVVKQKDSCSVMLSISEMIMLREFIIHDQEMNPYMARQVMFRLDPMFVNISHLVNLDSIRKNAIGGSQSNLKIHTRQ